MGSTGSGRFTDYSGSKKANGKGSKGGQGGGSSGTDRCLQALSCTLEEVSQCEFYATNGKVPAPNTSLKVILDKRLFAINDKGVKVGALPTKYNYLAACMKAGFTYAGLVTTSKISPTPAITADFVASDDK